MIPLLLFSLSSAPFAFYPLLVAEVDSLSFPADQFCLLDFVSALSCYQGLSLVVWTLAALCGVLSFPFFFGFLARGCLSWEPRWFFPFRLPF